MFPRHKILRNPPNHSIRNLCNRRIPTGAEHTLYQNYQPSPSEIHFVILRTDKLGLAVVVAEPLKTPLVEAEVEVEEALKSGDSAANVCGDNDCDDRPARVLGACVGPAPIEPGVVEGVNMTGSVGMSH